MEKDYELSDGVTFKDVQDQTLSNLPAIMSGFVHLQPYNQVMPKAYLRHQKRIKEFPVRSDDVWVASFPKCGTTWSQEIVWLLMNKLDYGTAKANLLDDRVPFLELSCIVDNPDELGIPDTPDLVSAMSSPRIIKTHLSFDMLPDEVMQKQAKVIYVTRNPRDVCVSLYHHYIILEGYKGDFQSFARAFLNDEAGYYTPFFGNLISYWKQRHRPNLLLINYEQMKKDLAGVLKKVAGFLGVPLHQEDLPGLLDHLSFDTMKNNPAVNKEEFVKMTQTSGAFVSHENTQFMRQGQSGNWVKFIDEDLLLKFQDWEKKWLSEQPDLKFDFI